MKALSLYSGGCDGLSLAGSWVGIETLAFCESDAACRAVLAARHPGKPIFESDEEVTEDAVRTAGIDPQDIDIVMGGPPCQCASIAGKRLGDGDPRNRWPEFLRIVREIKPRWVLAENSPELCTVNAGRLFGNILWELAEAGYDAEWRCWGASDVGAPHKRERLFILAYAAGERCGEARRDSERSEEWASGGGNVADAGRKRLQKSVEAGQQTDFEEDGAGMVSGLAGCGCMEYADRQRFEECDASAINGETGFAHGRFDSERRARPTQPGFCGGFAGVLTGLDEAAAFLENWPWPAPRCKEGPSPQYEWEPPRVAEGVPDRAARIRMIGNACPPQQYLPALWAIAEAERRMAV